MSFDGVMTQAETVEITGQDAYATLVLATVGQHLKGVMGEDLGAFIQKELKECTFGLAESG